LFGNLTDSFRNTINKIRFSDDENALKRVITELKKSLLKSDVHHKIVKELLTKIELDTKENGIGRDSFLNAIEKNLTEILTANGKYGFEFASTPPTVVLMTGLQGSGKTTTTAKLALYLKQKNKKVLIAAADLQRLAAVEQLKQLTSQIEVDLYFDDNEKDPIKIAKNALQEAKSKQYDVLLVDTAGRLAIDAELMNQLKNVKNELNPDEILYVADSLTGQDAVKTATKFKEDIGIDGVILTKFDGDSKGGIAISLAKQCDVPLRFIGIGEKMPDLEIFIPKRIVSRLMGAGDIEGLAEKTSSVMSDKDVKKVTKKIKKGKFNFNDFLEQMENMKKLGSMKSLVSMIPGLSNMIPKDIDLDNSKEIKVIRTIVNSMTPKERENPDLLNNSRKKRIANGAGLDIMAVNKAIKQFNNAAKMAKKFAGKKGMQDFQSMLSNMQAGQIPR
jgi:signal recognition particle subunit SRP54